MHTGALNFQGAFSNMSQDAEWYLEVAAISHSLLFASTSFNHEPAQAAQLPQQEELYPWDHSAESQHVP